MNLKIILIALEFFFYLHQDLDKVSFLLAISQTDFGKSLVKPRIKVGREFVNQGRNLQQVKQPLTFSLSGM